MSESKTTVARLMAVLQAVEFAAGIHRMAAADEEATAEAAVVMAISARDDAGARNVQVRAVTQDDALDLFVVAFAIVGLIIIAWLLGAFSWVVT